MPDGLVKTLHVIAHIRMNDLGQPEFMGTAMDVTAFKQIQWRLQASLEERDALLKEVHHRVKNNLQLISSLLSLQAARIGDPPVAELFAESRNRVRAMALVHENLYRAGNFARIPMRSHIQNLAAHLVRAYGLHSQQVGLLTEIDDIELDLDRAVSTGLIINELISNALKHAFPAGRPGQVRVVLKLVDGQRCLLEVTDDGVGLARDFDVEQAGSLGLQLVHDLTRQLQGTIAVSAAGNPLRHRLWCRRRRGCRPVTPARILVVEDDRVVARDIEQQLSRIGHVVVATTARARTPCRWHGTRSRTWCSWTSGWRAPSTASMRPSRSASTVISRSCS